MTTSPDDTIGLQAGTEPPRPPDDRRLRRDADRPTAGSPSTTTGPTSPAFPTTMEGPVDELRRQLRAERERALNATDRVLGAQAEAAQARAEIKELYHRLHVREAELAELRTELDRLRAAGGGLLAASEAVGRRASTLARRAADRARSR